MQTLCRNGLNSSRDLKPGPSHCEVKALTTTPLCNPLILILFNSVSFYSLPFLVIFKSIAIFVFCYLKAFSLSITAASSPNDNIYKETGINERMEKKF